MICRPVKPDCGSLPRRRRRRPVIKLAIGGHTDISEDVAVIHQHYGGCALCLCASRALCERETCESASVEVRCATPTTAAFFLWGDLCEFFL